MRYRTQPQRHWPAQRLSASHGCANLNQQLDRLCALHREAAQGLGRRRLRSRRCAPLPLQPAELQLRRLRAALRQLQHQPAHLPPAQPDWRLPLHLDDQPHHGQRCLCLRRGRPRHIGIDTSSGLYDRTKYGINYPYLYGSASKVVPNKIPTIQLNNFGTLDGGPYPSRSGGIVYDFGDTITKVWGSHTLKIRRTVGVRRREQLRPDQRRQHAARNHQQSEWPVCLYR